jgi:hypothetical protein
MTENHEEEAMAQLEAVVEKLLAGYNSLKQEKAELEARLRQKEYEVEELQEVTGALKEEKSVVHKRVSGLLSSIEDWEKKQAAA